MVADALSRRPATLSLMSLDTDWRARLLVEYSKDRFACEVLDSVLKTGLVETDQAWSTEPVGRPVRPGP